MEPTVDILARTSLITITVQFPKTPPNGIRAVKMALEDAHREHPWVVVTDEYTDDILRILDSEKHGWNSGEEVVVRAYSFDPVPNDRLEEYSEYVTRLAVSILEALCPHEVTVFAEIEHKDAIVASHK